MEMDRTQVREALLDFVRRYRADAAVRARVARGDTSDVDRTAAGIPDEMDIRVVEQTADTFYFPLPPAPNESLSDESLGAVSGGVRHGSCYSGGGRHGMWYPV